MKKKIAILTQPLGLNYGGIIQNYALQIILKNLGFSPLTIDRQFNNIPLWKIIGVRIKSFLLNRKVNNFDTADLATISQHPTLFIKKYITKSELLDSVAKFSGFFVSNSFDAFIVGSDQTWRPKFSPNLYSYYFDFLIDDNVKRFSYAASFGTSEWEYTQEQSRICGSLIKKFNAISVRENSGVEFCKTYFDIPSVTVLDPTLLLIDSDYDTLINRPRTNMGLFTYVLDKSENKKRLIFDISRILNLEHNSSQAEYHLSDTENRELSKFIIPPIENWLQGFRDAEYIITDSFHGTVFAIINKKPFISLVNQDRGASRFTSLLTQLGLMDRLLYDVNFFNPEILEREINYEEVEIKLNELRDISINFLKANLFN
jgi:hypothetical protein